MDEIQELIEDGNHLTFDFLALMTVASVIAAAGLVGDNVVFVIASMLVSPLMGPILSMTFGLAISKNDIVDCEMKPGEFLSPCLLVSC